MSVDAQKQVYPPPSAHSVALVCPALWLRVVVDARDCEQPTGRASSLVVEKVHPLLEAIVAHSSDVI